MIFWKGQTRLLNDISRWVCKLTDSDKWRIVFEGKLFLLSEEYEGY